MDTREIVLRQSARFNFEVSCVQNLQVSHHAFTFPLCCNSSFLLHRKLENAQSKTRKMMADMMIKFDRLQGLPLSQFFSKTIMSPCASLPRHKSRLRMSSPGSNRPGGIQSKAEISQLSIYSANCENLAVPSPVVSPQSQSFQ